MFRMAGSSLNGLRESRSEKRTHTRRVAVQKVAVSDRANLALREESRNRDGSKSFLHRSGIMVRLAEESLSPAATAE